MSTVLAKNGRVYFDDDFKSLQGIKNHAESYDKSISELTEELMMMAIANPKTLAEDDEDIIYTIKSRVKETVESIEYDARKLGELDLAEEMIYDWGNELTEEEITCSKTDEYQRATFNKEKPFEPKDYDSLSEMLVDYESDFQHEQGKILNRYYVTYKGEIIVDKYNQFLFVTAEEALKNAYERLDVNCMYSYLKKSYIEAHPQFFKDIREYVDNRSIDEYDELMKEYMTDDKNQYEFYKYKRLFDLYNEAFKTYYRMYIEIKSI